MKKFIYWSPYIPIIGLIVVIISCFIKLELCIYNRDIPHDFISAIICSLGTIKILLWIVS